MKTGNFCRLLLMVSLGFVLAGCENAHDEFNIHLSIGMGGLTVQNLSSSDFDVYVDGDRFGHVDSDDHLSREMEPGTVRVFLREADDNHQGFGEYVDILEGRNTIIRIYRDDYDWDDYDLTVEYD